LRYKRLLFTEPRRGSTLDALSLLASIDRCSYERRQELFRQVASNKNHVCRSASSIQFSSKLTRTTSPLLVAKGHASCAGSSQLLVVVAPLSENIQGRNVLGVLIQKTLQTANVAQSNAESCHRYQSRVFQPARLCQSRGWSSSVEGCSCNEQMSPPPKSSSGGGCVRRLGVRCFLASCFMRLNMMFSLYHCKAEGKSPA
jgi:hypothetical protein